MSEIETPASVDDICRAVSDFTSEYGDVVDKINLIKTIGDLLVIQDGKMGWVSAILNDDRKVILSATWNVVSEKPKIITVRTSVKQYLESALLPNNSKNP